MDLMTIFGLLAGALTVYYVMSTGNILHMLLNPAAAVLVFGGTFSAIMIAYPWDIIRHAIVACRMIFVSAKNTDTHREGLIDLITSLAEKARRLNLESLQEDLHSLDDKFLMQGLQMAVDGIEPDVLKENLERDVLYTRRLQQRVCSVFRTMATLSPIFGLLGTLIGIVQVLRNLSDPSSMGSAMAIAITTTFYGIFAANFLFLPLSINLNDRNENDTMSKELMSEGIMAIQQGDPPYIVKKKLNAFVISHVKAKTETKKK